LIKNVFCQTLGGQIYQEFLTSKLKAGLQNTQISSGTDSSETKAKGSFNLIGPDGVRAQGSYVILQNVVNLSAVTQHDFSSSLFVC
jgi:hypothetical protein